MKLNSFLLIIFLFFKILLSQDFQITSMAPYSVDHPYFFEHNGNIYLTFGTNMKFWKFPVNGISQPISNPINPDPLQWGPSFRTEISVDPSTGNCIIYYNDYSQTSNKFFLKTVITTDGGTNWLPFQYVKDVTKSN